MWGDTLTPAGQNIVWGENCDTATCDNIVWGNNIVWGESDANDNIVWGNTDGDNIVWGNCDGDNIVWGNGDDDNIVWGNSGDDNIVWGNDCGGADCDNIVWGNTGDDNIVWGNAEGLDNIVWGNTSSSTTSCGATAPATKTSRGAARPATRTGRLRRRHRGSRIVQPGSVRRSVRGRAARACDAADRRRFGRRAPVMEKMPFQPELQRTTTMSATTQPHATVTTTNWKASLPVLAGSTFTLRELRIEDATSLLAMLSTEEVARFISPPPTTVEGFERFIAWTQRERMAGNYACFAIVPQGMTTAIGIFQVRSLEPGFGTAEWGFAMGSQFWGSGIFAEGARLVLDFAFDVIGAQPARSACGSGQRPRQRRAAQDWRGAGGRASPLVPPPRHVSRPGAVGNPG